MQSTVHPFTARPPRRNPGGGQRRPGAAVIGARDAGIAPVLQVSASYRLRPVKADTDGKAIFL